MYCICRDPLEELFTQAFFFRAMREIYHWLLPGRIIASSTCTAHSSGRPENTPVLGSQKTAEVDCRRLGVQSCPVVLGGVQGQHLSHLNHHGIARFPGYERLGRKDIAKISSWTSLKILGLHNWKDWGDLSPLRLLPLKELGCTSVCMLLD